MKKRLVILTTHFGTNFSGGSTATCEIFSRLEDLFEEVVVVGTQMGDHPFKSLRFIQYRSWFDAIRILRGLNQKTIFYGDFYNAFLFILARVPFFFTYHDNWPELAQSGVSNKIRSLFYTNIYNSIFKKARQTITVSQFKLRYVNQYSSNADLIYNGFKRSSQKNLSSPAHNKIIMVGNIDKRKYKLALELFRKWSLSGDITVDIYGNITDQHLASQLDEFPFVSIKGFVRLIPYSSYTLLLHTSIMENLPIVFCEAVHHGIPVIAFDVGGANEIIDKESGFLIPPYDLNLMEANLKSVLKNPSQKRVSKRSLERHSWETASALYLHHLTN